MNPDTTLAPIDASGDADAANVPLRTATGIATGLLVSGVLWAIVALVALVAWR